MELNRAVYTHYNRVISMSLCWITSVTVKISRRWLKRRAPRLDTTQYRPKVLIAMIRTKHYVRNWIEILTIQMLNLNNGN